MLNRFSPSSLVAAPPRILQARRGGLVGAGGGGGFAAPDIASHDFNDGTFGPYTDDYGAPDITIIDDPTGAGMGKVCKLLYHVEGPPPSNVDSNTSISFAYPSGHADLYHRIYVYFVDPGVQGGIEVEKIANGLQRKIWYINAGEGPDYWTGTIQRWLDGATGVMDPDGIYGPRSVTKTGQPDFTETEFCCAIDVLLDTWYYFEYRVKLNDVGQANGIVQIWGGIKDAAGLADALLYQTTTATLRLNSNNYLSCRMGQQLDAFPNGHTIDDVRYIDKVAISTQRIGP